MIILSFVHCRGHNYPIWCLAESSTGVYLATGSRDLTARLWSTEREFPLQTYIGHTQDVDVRLFIYMIKKKIVIKLFRNIFRRLHSIQTVIILQRVQQI